MCVMEALISDNTFLRIICVHDAFFMKTVYWNKDTRMLNMRLSRARILIESLISKYNVYV